MPVTLWSRFLAPLWSLGIIWHCASSSRIAIVPKTWLVRMCPLSILSWRPCSGELWYLSYPKFQVIFGSLKSNTSKDQHVMFQASHGCGCQRWNLKMPLWKSCWFLPAVHENSWPRRVLFVNHSGWCLMLWKAELYEAKLPAVWCLVGEKVRCWREFSLKKLVVGKATLRYSNLPRNQKSEGLKS